MSPREGAGIPAVHMSGVYFPQLCLVCTISL